MTGQKLDVAVALWSVALAVGGIARAEEVAERQPAQRIVVSATRVETPYEQLGSSATVITRQDIERSQKTTVIELLRTVASIDVASSGGPGQPASVFIRGAKSEHTLVLIDGVEVNDPISPGRAFDWAHLTTDNIERIEIIRGPQSTLYGSDAIGGVINIITRKGKGRPRFTLSTEYGTYHTYRESAAVSGGTTLFNYSVSLARLDTEGVSAARRRDGNREDDAYENTTVAARFGLTPSENFGLDVFLRYSDAYAELDMAGGPGADDPNYDSDTQNFSVRTQARLGLLDGLWEQKLGVSYTDIDRRTHNDPDPTHPLDVERSSYDGEILRFDWQHNLYLHDTNTLTLGAETEEERGRSHYFSDGAWGPFTSDFRTRKARTNGYYVQDQIKLWDRFFTTVGARLDDHEKFGSETTYRIASAYLVRETGTKLKGSYGTGFKAPTLFQLYSSFGDVNLQPEKSRGWDVGVEQKLCNDRVTLGATYFHNDFTNLIDYNNATWKYENIGKARTRGVELAATVQPTDPLTLRGTYTYTHAEDVETGFDLLRRAKSKVGLDASYRLTEKARLNAGLAYIGKRKDLDFGTFPAARVSLESYVLVNVGASYDVTKHLTVFGRLENLFNEKYEEVKGYGTPGFGAFTGVRVTF